MVNAESIECNRCQYQTNLHSEPLRSLDVNLHRLEKAIERNRKQFGGSTEPAPPLTWISNPEGRCVFFNETWLEFTGHSPDAEREDGWTASVHPDDRENCLIAYWEAFRDRKPFRREYRLRRFDGEYRWISDTGVPRQMPDGTFLGYAGSGIDMTDRRRAEEELLHLCRHLRETVVVRTQKLTQTDRQLQQEIQERLKAQEAFDRSQKLLQLVMDNIPEAIFWKDRNSVYLGCNRRGASDAGVESSETLAGLTDEELPWREQAAFLRDRDRHVIDTDTPQYRQIETRSRPDGTTAYLETNRVPLHDNSGNVVGVLVTYEDITERNRAEKALLRIRKAVDSASDAIGIMDVKGIQIYQNRAFCDLFECGTVGEFNGSGGYETLYVDPTLMREVFDTIFGGSSWHGEVSKRTRTGRVVKVLLRADAIRDGRGELVGLICINTDITERKQTEAQILQTARELTGVIETVGEGITLSNSRGKFIIYNSKMREITGYSLQEAESSQDFLRLLYPEPRAHTDALTGIYEILERGGVRDVETTIRTKSGDRRTLLVSTSIVENRDDKLFLSTYRDITERTRALDALQKTEREYRSLFENAIEGIFQTTPDGRYINVNPALAKIYGFPSPRDMMAQLVDITRQLYVDPDRRNDFIGQLQRSDAIVNFESQVYRADGEIIWIAEKARVVRDSDGQILYYEGMVEDITERKQAEQNLRQQAERQRLMFLMIQRIRRSLKLDKILDTTVAEVREYLRTDRVVIYRFREDGNGVMVVESVAPGWKSVVGTAVAEDCWTPQYLNCYRQGEIHALSDLSTEDRTRCDINLFSELQVRANLVVPILTGVRGEVSGESGGAIAEGHNHLWGLLMVQHCCQPRQWESAAIDFLKQLALQLGIAIRQAELYQQLERLATLDGLTQVSNRRQFDSYLDAEWRRALRENIPISLILCDVDFFKRYNDTYGHQEGDRCLQDIAKALSRAIRRPADLVARYGGEEFAVILPNTDIEGMRHIAEAIRSEIRGLQRHHDLSPIGQYVSLSLGGASVFPHLDLQPDRLIAGADMALYEAKARGRDRFIFRMLEG